jgi:uncharacterized protein DUF2568
MEPDPMKQLLPALRFLLELATVAGAAVVGASVSWIIALLFPVAVFLIWATLAAPKSARRLADPAASCSRSSCSAASERP